MSAGTSGAPGEATEPQGLAPELVRIAPAALEAALEAIAAPAFVVRAPAAVLHANARGRALLVANKEQVLEALRTGPGGATSLRIPLTGLEDHAVVVFPDLPGDARLRVGAIARRWRLTPRQAAVLGHVAQGASNRTAAEALGCSAKTVELHVSALLAKTRCSSRAQLVASFWTDPG